MFVNKQSRKSSVDTQQLATSIVQEYTLVKIALIGNIVPFKV